MALGGRRAKPILSGAAHFCPLESGSTVRTPTARIFKRSSIKRLPQPLRRPFVVTRDEHLTGSGQSSPEKAGKPMLQTIDGNSSKPLSVMAYRSNLTAQSKVVYGPRAGGALFALVKRSSGAYLNSGGVGEGSRLFDALGLAGREELTNGVAWE